MDSNIAVELQEDMTLPFNGVELSYFSTQLESVLSYLDLKDASLTLILTSNREIHEINREYRSKDYPTDVISFANNEEPFPGEEEENFLGDIFLSLEKALEQSKEFGVTLKQEIDRLIVHSVLHLIGYYHERGE
jgi:probable rRNA maturation factor